VNTRAAFSGDEPESVYFCVTDEWSTTLPERLIAVS